MTYIMWSTRLSFRNTGTPAVLDSFFSSDNESVNVPRMIIFILAPQGPNRHPPPSFSSWQRAVNWRFIYVILLFSLNHPDPSPVSVGGTNSVNFSCMCFLFTRKLGSWATLWYEWLNIGWNKFSRTLKCCVLFALCNIKWVRIV